MTRFFSRTGIAAVVAGLALAGALAPALISFGVAQAQPGTNHEGEDPTAATAAPDAAATLHVGPATFVDNTGGRFSVVLDAAEFASEQGAGSVSATLGGPRVSLCSAHGPGAAPDSFPLTRIQCGGAAPMAVAIDRCVASITLHGYVHADHPFVTYLGMTTADIRFQRTGPAEGDVAVTAWTPKAKVILGGKATGPVVMPTCP